MDIKILGGKFKTFSHLFVIFCFLFYGCAGHNVVANQSSKDTLPEWVLNPSKNGVIGGVGYCAAHVDGISGQRELASKRALEEIDRQKGVQVDSIMVVSSKHSNQVEMPDTTIDTVSGFKTNTNVRAYIKEVWIHPVTKVMYVYMIAE